MSEFSPVGIQEVLNTCMLNEGVLPPQLKDNPRQWGYFLCQEPSCRILSRVQPCGGVRGLNHPKCQHPHHLLSCSWEISSKSQRIYSGCCGALKPNRNYCQRQREEETTLETNDSNIGASTFAKFVFLWRALRFLWGGPGAAMKQGFRFGPRHFHVALQIKLNC